MGKQNESPIVKFNLVVACSVYFLAGIHSVEKNWDLIIYMSIFAGVYLI